MGVIKEWTGVAPGPATESDATRKRREHRAAREEREQRMPAAAHQARNRLRGAELDLGLAEDRLEQAAGGLLLGDASEEDVVLAEREVEQLRGEITRWKAALRYLDGERGVIRDANGTAL